MRGQQSVGVGRGVGRGDGLALGVKGRLSNQEMEMLRAKLAQAVAYDHMPCDAKRAERHMKALQAAKPMTKIYRRVDEAESQDVSNNQSFRPGKKTVASIRYEATFNGSACDSLRVRPPVSKGISAAAKTRLQDEYVTNPRHVSSIPVNLEGDRGGYGDNGDERGRPAKSGKRAAPAPIPQVFLV